ncbi:MAG: nitroreductase family deazaflavin-dependent oxidoreductase [Acidothermaceae bacterium]
MVDVAQSPEITDPNTAIVDEFRANDGRVGGYFEGRTMVLMHHVGRKSGKHYVSPALYLPAAGDERTIYVFASKGGAPDNPAWYYNLVAAGEAEVEVATQRYPVTVRELIGDERDRVYAEQATRYSNFADYEEKTAGARVIPVLALTRK